jgi:outer membrane beta-barrel protein
MMGGAELGWSPVYGKLNIIAEHVIHFDLSVIGGGDFISYREVLDKAHADALAASGGTPPDKSTFGGHVGLGTRIFFTEFLAARVELKDYIYSVDVGNLGKGDIQHQIFDEFGLSVFFPFGFAHE